MVPGPTSGQITPSTLKVIRGSLLGGVLLFGGIVWYLHSTEGPVPVDADLARTLRLVFLVFAFTSLFLLLFLRSRRHRAGEFHAAAVAAIIAWAIGEAVALFGGVIYLLTADVTPYLGGVALMFIAFLVAPVPERPVAD